MLEAADVVGHRVPREFAQMGLVRAGVERVGRVGEDFGDAVFPGEGVVRRDILQIEGLDRAAAGVSREKLKDVRVDGHGRFPHGEVPVRGGEVAADFKHGHHPFSLFIVSRLWGVVIVQSRRR